MTRYYFHRKHMTRHTFNAFFSLSFAQGMIYLHDSPIVSHGNLKSSNCLVDCRWTIKLSDFGLCELKSGTSDVCEGSPNNKKNIDTHCESKLIRVNVLPIVAYCLCHQSCCGNHRRFFATRLEHFLGALRKAMCTPSASSCMNCSAEVAPGARAPFHPVKSFDESSHAHLESNRFDRHSIFSSPREPTVISLTTCTIASFKLWSPAGRRTVKRDLTSRT